MGKQRSIEEKLALLEAVEETGNVSLACKNAGFSRVSYYRIKSAFDQGGPAALQSRRKGANHEKKRIPRDVEENIVRYSLKYPHLGKHNMSTLLQRKGINISATGVRNVWRRNQMGTLQDRLLALLHRIEISGDALNRAQILAFKKLVQNDSVAQSMANDWENGKTILEKRLAFETLISELSTIFINLPVERIDAQIEKGQKLVCESLGLHRSAFMEFSEDKQTLNFTHVWQMVKKEPAMYPHDMIIARKTDFFKKLLLKREVVSFSKVEELEPTLREVKHALRKIGVTSALVFPLGMENNTLGGISWESHGSQCDWTPSLIERLRLVSEVFGNALSRKRAEEALQSSLREIKGLKDRLQAENLYLLDEIRLEKQHHRIVGQSKSIRKVLHQVEQVAQTVSTVLICGETGTGKELVAQAIHDLSPRKDHPMVKVNCSVLPPTLIESELFGHEKGAFTGASNMRMGRFELASGSTIFLDEIGDLPLELQPKLLRVLQEGQYERLGSTKTIDVNVRVIAATNRNLEQAVKEGQFRRDLYYRLNIFPIQVPPLRERVDDIPFLLAAFVKEFCSLMGKEMNNIPHKSIEALKKYAWPGNIRELKNLVERAMIITKEKTLRIQLPEPADQLLDPFETMEEMQRRHIIGALNRTGGRLYGERGAARLLGLNPKTLESRMKNLEIQREPSFSTDM
ncbi:MAG: sigma 54-interacting transcriptional regulator [Desulfatitalea sp.]|nr:sigma 54-interacting transcriptional regulator [Desulfatitalea sp.]NNK02347.1 sigma 54-interacting transcriptional regulator [Desulfatitalea sp.]